MAAVYQDCQKDKNPGPWLQALQCLNHRNTELAAAIRQFHAQQLDSLDSFNDSNAA